MNKQASVPKIIASDYAAFLGLAFPLIAWGMYLVLILFGNAEKSDIKLPIVFAGVTLVGLAVLAWRIQTIQAVFSDGIEAPAVISGLSFFRDRGRVDYVYSYQGQKYASGNAVMKNKRTRSLQVGMQMIVMVDRNQARRAFLRDLYIQESSDGN